MRGKWYVYIHGSVEVLDARLSGYFDSEGQARKLAEKAITDGAEQVLVLKCEAVAKRVAVFDDPQCEVVR